MKLVSIITVNYNHHSVTEEMLQSIYRTNSYQEVEVIVVDNGSKTNPVPEWEQKFPAVKFIRSEVNLGFAGGNNLGIAQAKGDYYFLVNNDTEFTEGLVERLVQTLEGNNKVGIVSPKIMYYDAPSVIQYMGYTEMNFFTARNRCIGQFEEDSLQNRSTSGPTGYAHGAAMMVRKEAIDKAGLMAENFFLYYEELDWCERIKKAGYQIWVNTDALIYHKESMSVGKQSALKEYYMNRNRILFMRKHAPGFAYIAFMSYYLLVVFPRNILSYVKQKQFSFIPVLFKAVGWNFTNHTNSNKLYFPHK